MTSAQRQAYLEFVRSHHPDRGGDHEVFVDGVAALRRGLIPGGEDDPRLDCPIHVVHRKRGLQRLLEILRTVREPPRPPRVR